MNKLNEYSELIRGQEMMALATSFKDQSNVRIINYIVLEDPRIAYFASFPGNDKIDEFEKNENVSFTTIPKLGVSQIRSQHAVVKKSKKSMKELAGDFIKQIPSYKDIIDQACDVLVVFEIQIDQASVTMDLDQAFKIKLS